MVRTPRCRRVEFMPGVTYFKPAGVPMRFLDEVQLSVEEVEAVRLKDLLGLEQEQGGERMNISRPTFQRVLKSARKKIADALLNGKSIRIAGGHYQLAVKHYCCSNNHQWQVPARELPGIPEVCPICGGKELREVSAATGGGFGESRGITGGAAKPT